MEQDPDASRIPVEDVLRPKTAARRRIAFAEVALAMSLAGSSVVAGKYLTGMLPVFTTGALSLFFAVLTMLPLQLAKRREILSLRPADVRSMVLQAFFGIVLFRICTLNGLKLTSAFHAGIVTSASPAVMTALSMILLRERPGLRRSIGIVCSAAGILIIHLSGASLPGGGTSGTGLGSLLIFIAVVGEGLLIVFRKSVPAVSSITNTTVVCLSGFLLMAPFAGLEILSGGFPELTGTSWLVVAYYGVIITAGGYLLMGDGAPHIPGSASGAAMSAMPVSAFVLSVLALGERVTGTDVAGCLLAVLGMLLGS